MPNSLYLKITQMPKSHDLAIFMPMMITYQSLYPLCMRSLVPTWEWPGDEASAWHEVITFYSISCVSVWISLCTDILRELKKIQILTEKKSKHKVRLEPATFCSTCTQEPQPLHHRCCCCYCCCQSLFSPFHRQILETNSANHWQPISPSHPYRVYCYRNRYVHIMHV